MTPLKYILLFCLFLYVPVFVVAQNKTVQGIVFDKGTNQRVGKAFIKNDHTKENTYNNARGEFEVGVSLGDLIITSKEGYLTDTIKYTGQQVLMVYLDRTSRSEEHTSELQSRENLVCRLLLEKQKTQRTNIRFL